MKKRIIPSILLKGGTNVCISQKFMPWRTVGTLVQNLRLHVQREADELLIINPYQAMKNEFQLSERLLNLIRKEVDIPISYLGGIKSSLEASICINAGFDKVYITSAFLEDNKVLSEISKFIGRQSLGVCLPYDYCDKKNTPFLWDYKNRKLTNKKIFDLLDICEKEGAGEIVLYNIRRDGGMSGLDLEIVDLLEKKEYSLPVLIAGGAGKDYHVSKVLGRDFIQGVVASSIFALTEATPKTIRSHCIDKGIEMRRV